MKNTAPWLQLARGIFLAALLAAAGGNSAAADDAKNQTARGEESAVTELRVEALLVAMPESKFIDLMPALHDNAKIAGAVAEILEGVKRKEMVLRGCPMLVTKSGQRAVAENTREIKNTPDPSNADATQSADEPGRLQAGVTMEVEAVLEANGRNIDLEIAVEEYEPLQGRQDPGRPVIFSARQTTSLDVQSGQYALLGAHKLPGPAGLVEVVVVRAVAVQVKMK